MKRKPKTEQPVLQKPANETPIYHLADVPMELRERLLDLCFRRLYHEALELLGRRGFAHYTRDDLINFYHWAPKILPGRSAPEPEPLQPRRDYEQPAAKLLADIHDRLAGLPPGLAERVDRALKQESIEYVANFLWKEGHGFVPADLYEYRKTLFPPNSLLDPYTAGVPLLRPGFVKEEQHPLEAPESESLPDVRRHFVQLLQQRTDALTVASPQLSDPSPCLNSVPSVALSVNPSDLLVDLRGLITRFVVLPELAAETLALWVVHTYAFTLRQVTTYIGVVSPEKRCGKTTLLELLGSLAHEAVAAANISPSALFRVIEEARPTLIIDEADTFLQARDEMAGILNAGYRKGNAYVVRVREGKSTRPGGTSYTSPQTSPVMSATSSVPTASTDKARTGHHLPSNTTYPQTPPTLKHKSNNRGIH